MRSIFNILLVVLSGLTLAGCTPIEAYQAIGSTDRTPPIVTGGFATSERSIKIICNETVRIQNETFGLSEGLMITDISVSENSILIETENPLVPGSEYILEGVLSDLSGNTALLTMAVYGWNPDPPVLIINEFTTKGSKRHPDAIELLVIEDGNMAGLTLYDGISDDYRQRCIFPPLEVHTGEYVIIHCSDIPESFESIPEDHQFSMGESIGLSGNNGAISLYTSAHGEVLDAVIYSNRSSDSDTDYLGFGSRSLMFKVHQLHAVGIWDSLTPEGAVRTDSMTATRSACRNDPYKDTDSSRDWHTVPTSSSSFGEDNCNEIYQ